MRVDKGRYVSAFSELKLEAGFKPSVVRASKLFLLQELPRNLNHDTFDSVATEISWAFRVLKKKPNGLCFFSNAALLKTVAVISLLELVKKKSSKVPQNQDINNNNQPPNKQTKQPKKQHPESKLGS